MPRVNFSPGANRDLDKPLVEIDPDAPRPVRWLQRLYSIYLWTIVVYGVGATVLLALLAAVALALAR